jgi:hypothetical protein
MLYNHHQTIARREAGLYPARNPRPHINNPKKKSKNCD